ncbi:TetR/AcrR family transcriptional regulator [Pseudonocardia sp. KRD-184]|uniref:TetR/AcrR family transcriptional regulator n=1 Tax=Pseudonocardia oceani TaxID=2792013 RepID=A0ABS6U8Z5_9PSEU|nr:TetR/AcrR family transcriptional regulator [Pseudonocardia oceani]MBW0088656.1 TetR/AcrR family transcriptional regulator [Pseudonocardia oceani]MBW0095524.1 TetR/AcrR family transcriptional regulator [Pseudonocardia oceani]MBW0108495.1 TetR/AcrR family transcriptional regulator [Pseudonocardia oceani]MBW0121535.1 TetR/AcrR family transcriptional regulator [Pseudonocardia oceani]MBW0128716.1 TetR/AcrR family transcriptional regulator [Pseudonocardia oceani]
MTDERRRRPGGRTARVTAAVRAATVAALTEHGWNGLAVEDVAARAGVNKTTIYRRWGGRDALVADILLAAADQRIAPPDTGTLRGDLVAFVRQVRDALVAPANRALMSTLAGGGHDSSLAELGRRYWAARFARARPMVERAVARGELAADVDADALIVRVVGPVWFGVFGPRTDVDDAFVEDCVEIVLRGTATQAGNSSVHPEKSNP